MKKIKLYFFTAVILFIGGLLFLELLSRIYLQYSTGSYRLNQSSEQLLYVDSYLPTVSKGSTTESMSLNLTYGYSQVPDYPITDFIPNHALRQYLEVKQGDSLPQLPWLDMKANNYGFTSYYDYPYQKKENDFVVGIWGGSVAYWMSIMGKDSLVKYLQKYFKNKNIVILNFASGGMKQPQSLSVLSYFYSIGQKFDAAIFLDGFNETFYSWRHANLDLAISSPSSDWLMELYILANRQWSTEYLVLFYNAIRSKEQQLDFESRHTNFASVLLFQNAYAEYYEKKYKENKEKLLNYKAQKTDLIFLPPKLPQEKERHFETVTEIWKNATIAANGIISSDKNSIFVQAIQPNRYFPAESAKHEAVVSGYITYPAWEGYPHLIQASEDLRNYYGITSLDLTGLFSEERDGVFADEFSHFTMKGNDIVAKVLADTIIKIHKAKSPSQ